MTVNVRQENRPFVFTLNPKAQFSRSPNNTLIIIKSMFTIDIFSHPQSSLARQIKVCINIINIPPSPLPPTIQQMVQLQPRQTKVFSPRLYQKRSVEPGSEFGPAAPGHILLDDIVSHKCMWQASSKNIVQMEEKLPVTTPTITFMQVVIQIAEVPRVK